MRLLKKWSHMRYTCGLVHIASCCYVTINYKILGKFWSTITDLITGSLSSCMVGLHVGCYWEYLSNCDNGWRKGIHTNQLV